MNVSAANKKLHEVLRSDRWFFEFRGNKIVFLEKLENTYNLVFPLHDGHYGYHSEVFEQDLRQAISFVRRRRRVEDYKIWDKKAMRASGLYDTG